MSAYLALGSNLGDRLGELRRAVVTLRALDPALSVSAVFETDPVGGPPGQPPFLNCVVRLRHHPGPRALLGAAGLLEQQARRWRSVPDGPRTLDVDVLLVDDVEVRDADLVVPHPRLWVRAFVLAPLEDVAPWRVPPGWREDLARAGLASGVRRLGRLL